MFVKMKKVPLVLLLAALSSSLLADDKEDQEMAELLAMLEEETELATQSKMNSDYVPGMVTLLHGDQLRSYGIKNVAEALNQVAGFYTSVNNEGNYITIVRGTGAALDVTNLKMLVDGVSINRPVDASADWALRIPISQVDRIEIIRGPGSALYGEFAFAGVVNVITQKNSQLNLQVGKDHLKQLSAQFNKSFASGAQLSVNLSGWDKDKSGNRTNLDNFAEGGFGYSPGEIFDQEKGNILFAQASHHGYKLQLNYAEMERGGWYGLTAVMPEAKEPRKEKVVNLTIAKSWDLEHSIKIDAEVGRQTTEIDFATYLPIPPGAPPPGGAQPLLVNDFRRDGNEDSSNRAKLSLHWQTSESNKVYAELGYTQSEVEKSYNYHYQEGLPPIYTATDATRVLANSSRRLTSLTLQDQWQVNKDLEITLGARSDHYDDWGNNTSPRLAAVWRADEKHIFKFQFAQAFRPPTMQQQYPGPNSFPGTIFMPLHEETLSSTELAYIYRDSEYTFRSTLFKTQIEDLIEFYFNPGQPPIWRNRGDIDVSGLELEWQQKINREWEWFANLSYTDAKDHLDLDEKLLGSVSWLANLELSWQPTSDIRHSLKLDYTGSQEGWELRLLTPVTDTFDAFTTLDYTFMVKQFFGYPTLTFSGGIRNLNDENYNTLPNPAQFPSGLPLGERDAWLELNYGF